MYVSRQSSKNQILIVALQNYVKIVFSRLYKKRTFSLILTKLFPIFFCDFKPTFSNFKKTIAAKVP